jgi:ribosome modulation factor
MDHPRDAQILAAVWLRGYQAGFTQSVSAFAFGRSLTARLFRRGYQAGALIAQNVRDTCRTPVERKPPSSTPIPPRGFRRPTCVSTTGPRGGRPCRRARVSPAGGAPR